MRRLNQTLQETAKDYLRQTKAENLDRIDAWRMFLVGASQRF